MQILAIEWLGTSLAERPFCVRLLRILTLNQYWRSRMRACRGLTSLQIVALAVAAIGCRSPMEVCTNGLMRVRVSPVNDNSVSPVSARILPGTRNSCNFRVALIDIDGVLLNKNVQVLMTNGENAVSIFREKLDAAAKDPRVVAVLLRINSPGGGVAASDMMRRDLLDFKHRKNIPIVACLMDVSAGGAYYIATAADRIVAHPTTITGGLGVILNLYNLQDTLAQFNVQSQPIKAGERIDLGTPVKPLPPESKAILQKIADEFGARLQQTITQTRQPHNIKDADLFDGRIFSASQALEIGLVDDIGYLDDSIAVAEQLAGVEGRTSVVMYRRDTDRALTPYDITPNLPVLNSIMPLSIPGMDRSQLPTYLYMWQPEPLLEKNGGT